jgi:hypothetical protein
VCGAPANPDHGGPSDDGYTYTNLRATPMRDQGGWDASERQDHGEQLVRRDFGEVTMVVE